MKKYELTDEYHPTIPALRRIRALRDFGDVKRGDLGGYVLNEDNLSHEGTAWVYENAQVHGTAMVYGNARVYGNAQVAGFARVHGSARVGGNATVFGYARLHNVKTSLLYVLDCPLYRYAVIKRKNK